MRPWGSVSGLVTREQGGTSRRVLVGPGWGFSRWLSSGAHMLTLSISESAGLREVQLCHRSAGPGHCCPGSDQWSSLGSRGRAAHSPGRSPRSQPRRQHWGHRIEPPTQLPGSVWGSVHSPHSVVITSQAGLDQAQRKPKEQKMREARQACGEPWCLQDAGRLLAGWGAAC